MNRDELWTIVHAERGALADDLAGLNESQWATPSWSSPWSVRDVLAHMTATAKTTSANFFPKLLASGLSFTTMSAKDVIRERGDSTAQTLDRFRSVQTSTKRPPGPPLTMLGETIVHAEDIRRPLGIAREYPKGAVIAAADFFKGSNLIIGTKRRIAGVRLVATDVEWQHGEGPEAKGPMTSLLLAMTGRKGALDALSGEGVGVLAGR